MLRVLSGRGTLGNVRSSKKTISKVPWASMSQNENQLKRALYFAGMANFKLPAFVSGFLCRQTQRYGSMELCLLWRLPRTRYNEHGRTETVQSLYGDQGPLCPGNSHVQIHKVLSSFSPDSYKLIHFSEKETTSATHHPSLQECSSNTLRHPSPYLISQPPNPGS